MKRREKRIITSFIIVLCLLLGITSIAAKPKGYDAYDILAVNRTVRAVRKEKKNSLDVLILGNSSAYIAYSPMQMWGEYGFTSYNLGTASQRLCDSYALLKKSFETQHPKVVILECNSVYNPTGAYQERDNHSLTVFGRIFPILHYHSLYKLLPSPKELLHRNHGESVSDRYKGFTPKQGIRPYKMQKDDYHAKTKKVSAQASDYLLQINRLCRENNAELQLVVTPAPAEWDAGESQGLKQWSKAHHIAFLDFNRAKGLNLNWKKDTVDHGSHLNIGGSIKITSYLGKYLKNEYQLPDHRSDSAYAQWQKTYKTLPEYKSDFDPYGGKKA